MPALRILNGTHHNHRRLVDPQTWMTGTIRPQVLNHRQLNETIAPNLQRLPFDAMCAYVLGGDIRNTGCHILFFFSKKISGEPHRQETAPEPEPQIPRKPN